ncbi:MAG: Gfo/Idh/MocA family protein [bacterium]
MTVKFAIAGCGRILKKHIDAINCNDKAELVAVCDIVEEKAKKAGTENNVPWYLSYNEMLSRHPEAGAVIILTPSGMHPEHVIDIASKFKRHIVCEKPMALKLEDADRMIRTCDTNGVQLFVVKQNRFNLPVQMLRKKIESGGFGKIVLGTVRVRWCRTQDYYDSDSWRGTWAMDGGVIANQASHHIDLLEWMLGDPVSVMAMNGTYLSKIEVDDTCAAIIRFKSGAIGIVEATTATRPKDLEGSLSILGEKGNCVIGGFSVNKLEQWNFVDEPAEKKEEILAKYSENPPNVYGFGHIRYLESVIDSIENGTHALVDGLEGRRSLELINAIYESVETGKEVKLVFEPKWSKLGK